MAAPKGLLVPRWYAGVLWVPSGREDAFIPLMPDEDEDEDKNAED